MKSAFYLMRGEEMDKTSEELYDELTKEYCELPDFQYSKSFSKEKFLEMIEYYNSGEYDAMIREANSKPLAFCQTREWYRNNKQFCLDNGMSEEEYNERFM
jgi:Fe-S-cluster formation regulator IscX/YfhJ